MHRPTFLAEAADVAATRVDRRRVLQVLAAAGAAVTGSLRQAQAQATWPNRPIKLMVGFPGGSTPDLAARLLADAMSKAFGQPVIVDNRPGASGNIAADIVAKAGDDHTLGVVINGNLSSAKLLNPKLAYDPAKDFTYLTLLATSPLVLVAAASQPGGSAFFAAARAAGSGWNFGSVGIGSVGHLGGEYLQAKAGFAAVHVPYNGNPAVVTALIGGQIQFALMPPGIAMPQIQAGKLRAIAVTGPRSALAPDVPALSELGVLMEELEVWVALVGPAGLSRAAADRLARELPLLLNDPDTRKRLLAAGWQVQAGSPDALRQRVAVERNTLGAIITARGIKVE